MKIFSIPYNFTSILLLSIFFLAFLPTIYADVLIHYKEYTGYYDSQGIYTVVGNVKNINDFAVIPTITISVIDGENKITKTLNHVPIPIMTDIPFKLKFPEVKDENPIVLESDVTYVKTQKERIPIQIIYDKTLVTHDDGHVTGRIQNSGNHTIYNPKIFALVHGSENILDVSQNIDYIEKIEPGQILNFTIYPDPSVSEPVRFYSCFAPVDSSVTPVTTKKNGGKYEFRYDSGSWYYNAQFNDAGTVMTILGTNSYPIPTYVNFEFPQISGEEKFKVIVDGEPIHFIQSIDEMQNWHVAFDVEGSSQTVVEIHGFAPGLPEPTIIPSWIKLSAKWWSENEITDIEFLEGIEFLISKNTINVESQEKTTEFGTIPSWMKITMGWWSEGKISDEDFLAAVKNLVSRGIILV